MPSMALLGLLLALASLPMLLAGAVILGQAWFLALVALLHRAPRASEHPPTDHTFAVVIPAHNEAAGLPATLRTCNRLDYPPDRFAVYVVADNCSDDTATIARAGCAVCFERREPDRLGKGYALEHAIHRIDWNRHDVLLVLDADCLIDPPALRELNRELHAGARALQVNNTVSNPDTSALSLLLAVGNLLENDFFYAPRSVLGWPVLLRGTGMALHRDLLRRFPWKSFSLTEDLEYSLILVRAGVSVRFVPRVAVRSLLPITTAALDVQRSRWARGNLRLARREAWRLILEGLSTRRWRLIDLGTLLLASSRPLLAVLLLLGTALALAGTLIASAPILPALPMIGALLLLLFAGYIFLGLLRLGITRRRLALCCQAPGAILRLTAITLAALLGRDRRGWQRTPRTGTQKARRRIAR